MPVFVQSPENCCTPYSFLADPLRILIVIRVGRIPNTEVGSYRFIYVYTYVNTTRITIINSYVRLIVIQTLSTVITNRCIRSMLFVRRLRFKSSAYR
jgi:hypothetical protein